MAKRKRIRWDRVLIVILLGLIVYLTGVITSNLIEEKTEEIVNIQIPISEFSSAKSSIFIAAVSNTGEGVLSKANVEIREGEGRILVNTNPFIEPDTQFSLETSRNVAQEFTGIDLSKKDVIYSFSETRASLVGGPSAGAAFAVATIAAIQNKNIKSNSSITGAITNSGVIAPIGDVFEKLNAAIEQGVTLFLIPKGQGEAIYYTKEKIGGKTRLIAHKFSLNGYASQFGVEVKEVSTIDEAVGLLVK
ncbi:MAG: hypothetical protein HYS32_02750 [Candidatus Woesearchaeota archaeon]|nr:MAG: hypothetical protein HYS32_02750 [Candidatus Woesearchaeota archaeon]